MASKKPRTQSTEAQGGPSIDSVYDFLYYDAVRIASFLSQFDKSGHLREIVQSESVERSRQSAATIKGTGGVPLVASVEGEHDEQESSAHQKGSQRVYDPAWANALVFLDYLDERNMIQRDITRANMGQFVLCSGELLITDLQLIEKMWQLPSIKKLMQTGYDQKNSVNPRKKSGKVQQTASEFDVFVDLLSILPHTIQAKIEGPPDVWCSLSQVGMSTLPSDITLKHGIRIPGKWHALGIFDAYPDFGTHEEPAPDFTDGIEIAAKLMGQVAPAAKNLLGRPKFDYGITPLLIFREVVGP